MSLQKISVAALILTALILTSSLSHAATTMAFSSKMGRVIPTYFDDDDNEFLKCASVQFTAPAKGYAVVTANGMAAFNNDYSFLILTLSPKANDLGPWQYRLTPGYEFYQTFTARWIFSVGANKSYTFYLNGMGCKGPSSGEVSVETANMTVEFYPRDSIQKSTQPVETGEAQDVSEGIVVNKP
jgi:hypothetical protein